MPSDSCIPLVPFESYDEYEENVRQLIKKYQAMVKRGANIAQISSRSRIFQGLSFGVQGHWLEHGKRLFLELTKGQGEGWCDTMNTMVVHALDTSVRVFVQTRDLMNYPVTGSAEDQAIVDTMLKRETERAIAERGCTPNNM